MDLPTFCNNPWTVAKDGAVAFSQLEHGGPLPLCSMMSHVNCDKSIQIILQVFLKNVGSIPMTDPWCWHINANIKGVYWWDPWSTIYSIHGSVMGLWYTCCITLQFVHRLFSSDGYYSPMRRFRVLLGTVTSRWFMCLGSRLWGAHSEGCFFYADWMDL